MSNTTYIDLRALVKAMDGKDINFLADNTDGRHMTNRQARECIANYIAIGYDKIPMREDNTPMPEPEHKDSTRLTRLKKQLADAEQRRMDYMRRNRCVIVPAKMLARIAALKDEIEEAEAYEPKRLSDLVDRATLDRHHASEKVVKMHVAADYLTETANVFRDTLDEMGLQGCSLFPLVRDIERKAGAFAAIVCHPEFAGLSNFMSTNESLIRSLDIIIDRYIKDHLEIETVNDSL